MSMGMAAGGLGRAQVEQLASDGGEEQGSRLAHGPGQGQQVAGDEAGQGAAEHDGADHPAPADPEGQRPPPTRSGHGPHGRLRSTG